MEYYRSIDGHNVWVTTLRPCVFDEAAGVFVQPNEFCVAFKIDAPPAMLTGEFLRQDDGKPRWFQEEKTAANAGLEAARDRIDRAGGHPHGKQ